MTEATNTAAPGTPVVQADSFLTLHYRLSGPLGDVIDTFLEQPATLSLGNGELSPAIEQMLIGLPEGTHTTFELPAGAAFGERNPQMLQWLKRSVLKEMGDPDEQYAVGEVVLARQESGSIRLAIRARAEFAPFIAAKGSITVDGVSLTVNDVRDRPDGACDFALNIIPHTGDVTTIGALAGCSRSMFREDGRVSSQP